MNENPADRPRLLRRLAWTGSLLAFGLIVLGGVVRITGSGMGCGDHWPRCNGEWFPPLDLPTLIESSHRWVAALVSVFVFAVTVVAWRRHRSNRALLVPATLASVLLIAQVLLGAITVWFELPPWVVITHLANAMALLATMVVVVLRASDTTVPPSDRPVERHPDRGLIYAAGTLGFVVILFGAKVANFNAGLLCQGFPLCNGSVLPPPHTLGALHWWHRVLAFSFLGLVGFVYTRTRQRASSGDPVRRAAGVVLGLTLAQIGVAAAMVLHLLPSSLRALHLLVGTAIWVGLVVLMYRARNVDSYAPSARDVGAGPRAGPHAPSLISDLVTLTKPRIISLLLVTTILPMYITDRGVPPLSLVLWVTVAGYLMAGGANAINMWFDRDIDDKMARTRLRPVPSGRISAPAALAFGITLGAVAFALFWRYVNPLSAWLALGGLLFYVFVYTMWLKRSSPQNIVIGGAAGAFPPLVGWAAVTGRIDLAAIYLFAIIFYWTPPHFWALALMKRGEYAKAGVPMLPVVRGERRTKYEMLVYTLFLLPLTIMPSVFGALGLFYGVAAALLGARLLWYCIQLLREESVSPTAWRMYRYSLLYLALLFVAMGIDRALPFGHGAKPHEVLILSEPDQELATPAGHAPHDSQ